MTENEKRVYDFLSNWKSMQSIDDLVEEQNALSPLQKGKQQELLDMAARRLASWMRLLDDDERFVVKRHLIDGISWAHVVYEYNHLLKRSIPKSSSSLRRLQHQAIAKVALSSGELIRPHKICCASTFA